MNSQSLARGLAFFSLGLGMAELIAPKSVARLIGVEEDNDVLLRAFGLREIGAGLGIMQGNTATFVWSRVAGDVVDLGCLAAALRSRRSDRQRVTAAIAAVAGVTLVDVVAGIMLSQNPAQDDWRVRRDDLAGIERGDPVAMRAHADEQMAAHQSGHLHREDGQQESAAAEAESAMSEFEPGD